MKKNALLFGLMLAFIGFSMVTSATVLRVNSAPGSTTSYTTAQAAHDAASANDTLYLESSGISYGGLIVNKKITIIGTGYFLAQNPQTQAITASSYLDYCYFYPGSNGSKISGCTVPTIYLYDNNILIARNYINGYSSPIYQQSTTLSNIVITQNYITCYYPSWSALYFTTANNILVTNNFIYGGLTSGTAFSAIVTNNVINGYFQFYNATYTNNIMIDGQFYNYNCTANYNIANATQFGDQNGNQQNVNMANVFVGPTGNSTDGQYQLKAGSPAIGAGENGADCGMFGGSFPYVLSGMPNIPAIYYMNAPAIPSNSINVSIKAKSHN